MKKRLCIQLQIVCLTLENLLVDIQIRLSKRVMQLCARSITLLEAIHAYREESKK